MEPNNIHFWEIFWVVPLSIFSFRSFALRRDVPIRLVHLKGGSVHEARGV